ncbi:mucin-5AC-like [Varroa jacobsoni]|uniref:mucin-5AC-like n=1 Tax=Varroa jacobsoni TaxID=62625 RepID=UPI000BF75DEF|nr:mucin-5AC-like [Varroa jacobsoni]
MRALLVLLLCVALAQLSQAKSLAQVLTRGIRSADSTTDTNGTQSPLLHLDTTPKADDAASSQASVEASNRASPVLEQISSTSSSPAVGAAAALVATEAKLETVPRVDEDINVSVEKNAPATAPTSSSVPSPVPSLSAVPEAPQNAIIMKDLAETMHEVKEVLVPVTRAMKVVDEAMASRPSPASLSVSDATLASTSVPTEASAVNDINQNDAAIAEKAAEILAEVVARMPDIPILSATKKKSVSEVSFVGKRSRELPMEASMPEAVIVSVGPLVTPVEDSKPVNPTLTLPATVHAEPLSEASMPGPVMAPVEAWLPAIMIASTETPVQEETLVSIPALAPIPALSETTTTTTAATTDTALPLIEDANVHAARSDTIPAQEIHIDDAVAPPAVIAETKVVPAKDSRPENQIDNAPSLLGVKVGTTPKEPATAEQSSEVMSTSSIKESSPSITVVSPSTTENAASSTIEDSPSSYTSTESAPSSTEAAESPMTSEPINTTSAPASS